MRQIDADRLYLHFNDWALSVSPDEKDRTAPEYSEHDVKGNIYETILQAMRAIEEQPTVRRTGE